MTPYPALFERYEANERGRQIYVERMIRDRKPSFGYVVLAISSHVTTSTQS